MGKCVHWQRYAVARVRCVHRHNCVLAQQQVKRNFHLLTSVSKHTFAIDYDNSSSGTLAQNPD
jgi:hypothetical protein